VIRILKQQYSKFSWQAAPSTKVIGTFVHAEKVTPFFGFSDDPGAHHEGSKPTDENLKASNRPEQPCLRRRAFGFCCY
jgi:hypothetical protein